MAQAQKQVQAASARVEQAKANAPKAQLDVDRYTPLVQKDVISKQQYDAAVAQAAASKAAVLEAEANVLAAQNAVGERAAEAGAGAGAIAAVGEERARAGQGGAVARDGGRGRGEAGAGAGDQAKLNLSYTKIAAPDGGHREQEEC